MPKKNNKITTTGKSSIYIRGWKELASYTGFHSRTLQKWHYERAKIPFLKLATHTDRARWVITPDRVHIWLNMLGRI